LIKDVGKNQRRGGKGKRRWGRGAGGPAKSVIPRNVSSSSTARRLKSKSEEHREKSSFRPAKAKAACRERRETKEREGSLKDRLLCGLDHLPRKKLSRDLINIPKKPSAI